jgi:hypothetical protein
LGNEKKIYKSKERLETIHTLTSDTRSLNQTKLSR